MGWDPSMATSSCKCCGKSVEAWIEVCEDCEEKEAKGECIHHNVKVIEQYDNGYFKVKCQDCKEEWIDG